MSDSLFSSINISASGMSAQRTRMNVVAENIANAESTHTASGGPYQRRQVVLQSVGTGSSNFSNVFSSNLGNQSAHSVKVEKIIRDRSPFQEMYKPFHPDANSKGMVSMPNVNPVMEMVDMNSAARNFEANVTALEASKRMFMKTLNLLR